MTTIPTEITMKAGLNKNTTDYANEGKWIDGDKIRFRDLKPEKIGGWQAEQTSGVLDGVSRDLLTWVDLTGNNLAAFATHKRLQLLSSGIYVDITPISKTENPPTAMHTVNTSSTVTVQITNHDAKVGDYIFIRNSSGLLGTTIDPEGEWTVLTIVDTDNFTVDMVTNATTTATNGAWTGDIDFLLPIGLVSNTPLFGYGADTYGSGKYGNARGVGVTGLMRQWSLAKFGEDLIANPRNGNIYRWDASIGTGTRAQVIANAPVQSLFTLVSDQARHVISFGCTDEAGNFDPLLVRWSSSEDVNTWAIAVDNTAGNQRLTKGTRIIGAVQSKREIIVFTDKATYSMRYTGGTLLFAFSEIANNTGAISPHSGIDIEGRVYWMGQKAFYIYDGATRTMRCDLQKAVFDNDSVLSFNKDQQFKVYCGSNTEFQEVWWFYPASTEDENSRYVIYNYGQDIWYDGTIERTVWEDSEVFDRPLATSATTLFLHEQGKDDDASVMESFIESGDLEADDGMDLMFADSFIPDFKLTGPLDFYISWRKYPQDPYTEKGPYEISSSTSKVDFRIRGRQLRVKYSSNSTGSDWEAGKLVLKVKPSGGR